MRESLDESNDGQGPTSLAASLVKQYPCFQNPLRCIFQIASHLFPLPSPFLNLNLQCAHFVVRCRETGSPNLRASHDLELHSAQQSQETPYSFRHHRHQIWCHRYVNADGIVIEVVLHDNRSVATARDFSSASYEKAHKSFDCSEEKCY